MFPFLAEEKVVVQVTIKILSESVFCAFVCVSVRRHEGETRPHSGHWSAGVPVLLRRDVRVGFARLRPEGGGLLRLPMRQRHRGERHAGRRSVPSPPHACRVKGKKQRQFWKMSSSVSCRLQRAGRPVLPHFHHRLLREQLLVSAVGFLLRLLWHNGGTDLGNVSPTLELTSATGRNSSFFWVVGMSLNLSPAMNAI